MSYLGKQLTRFSRVSYRDLGILAITVLSIVNFLGALAWTVSTVWVLCTTGHWSWWPW